MNWKRVISGVLAAAMLSALPVQLLVSAEGTEAVGQADGWEELTTLESLDESNTFFYSKDDQTFEKITHPEKDVKTADGIVDYLGDGAVAVVTDPEDAAYNAGDRGQNYAWSAVGYGETVCLLSKLNAKQHIEVDIHMDELDLTDAEKKATYSEIKEYVLEHTGLKVSSLYIAQVKQKCGIIERENYNKPKSDDAKQPQCPPDKEKAIKEALKHFGMI